MKTLYDWQEEDVCKALEHDSWFIAYEMGLGKTVVAVEWAKRKGVQTAIVVCPLNTRRSWEATIKEQMPGTDVYWLENTPKHVSAFGFLKVDKPGWYLIGWEMMRGGAITGKSADLIIADETHKQANYGRSNQAIFIREIESKYKLALSGTPAANKPEGIFGTINWLWPKRYKSYWNWVEKFWRVKRNGNTFDLIRELHPGAIIADIPMFTRRLRKDHRDDMPAVLPEIPIMVELSAAQRKLYARLEEEAGAWLDEDNFMSTAIPLVQDIRLRQIALAVPTMVKNKDGLDEVTFKPNAGSSKIDALIEVLKSPSTGEESFLVLTHSAKVIPTVVHKLEKAGIKARGFSGDTKTEERDWLLDNLGGEYRVLVAGIAAIGEGTDGLQYKCHNMFWLSKHPNWLLNKQASMRLDRPGQTEPINQWYTYAEHTVDVTSLERLDEIEENLEAMLDDPTRYELK